MPANAIDLTNITAVRGYLGLTGVTAGGPITATTIPLATPAGVQTVTPVTMANIKTGQAYLIDSGAAAEYVVPSAITSTTFTATFAFSHGINAAVTDQTDGVLQYLVTSASQTFLSRTGFASLNSIGTYDEWYDGNGNDTLMLREYPIVTVTGLFINTRSIMLSASPLLPGFVIDASGKSIRLRNGGGGAGVPFTFAGYAAYQSMGTCGYGFPRGIQNVEVKYTAGYSNIPYDVGAKVTQLVAVNYRRTNWIDQLSQNLSGTGSTTFHKWIWPPEVEDCLQRYQRRSAS